MRINDADQNDSFRDVFRRVVDGSSESRLQALRQKNLERPKRGTDAVIEFKLPELGENIEQGDLVRLMVAPGATVSTGQSVMELETDKAVVEVPSSVSGTVQEVRVKEGDKIKVGQVIFTVDNGAGSKSTTEPAAEAAPPKPEVAAQPAPVEAEPKPSPSSPPSAPAPVRQERRAQPQ